MSYQLNDLLEDSRLQRLFLLEKKPCVLQIWILQIKKENIVENRLIYGRLVPYSYSDNSWSFSDKDTSQHINNFRASVTQLNLYIDSSLCCDLLNMLCARQSISTISEVLKLTLPQKLSKQYGNTILISKIPIFRPVIYLLNRDAYISNSLLSPHGSAGALSAAISISDKQSLFIFEDSYSCDLTSMVIKRLKEDTGMDFGSTDIERLGDIELLIFPTLDDDKEKNLLTVERVKYKGISIKFTSSQIPAFDQFQFNLICENNNQVFSSRMALAQSQGNGIFEYYFEIDENLFKITDSTKINIFGFRTNTLNEGYLCCSWKINYIKEINLRIQAIGNSAKPIQFDWLEKTVNPKMSDRVVAALSSSNKGDISTRQIRGDVIDPWVEENYNLKSLFHKINSPKSNGRFFLRWGKTNGEGRLEFVEWFKELLEKHQNRHLAIFDPYFEDVGLSLLTLHASSKAEYTIFRTVPKPVHPDVPRRRKTDDLVKKGIDNLIANCEKNRELLQRSRIKIYGMKEEHLHDRYILVIGENHLPIEGYHLSNSFQKATENYPLLITPIPIDVLYKINQYTFDLIQDKYSSTAKDRSYPISILFDSKSTPVQTERYEPLSVLSNNLAGTILSVWLENPLLKGLSGDELISTMKKLGVLENDSLHNLPEEGLFLCLAEIEGELSDFMETWKVIGDLLAHTLIGETNLDKIQFESKFLLFLSLFLSKAFQRNDEEADIPVINPTIFDKTLPELLQSPIRIHNFFQSTKYSALNWAEFYTIEYLWRYAPKSLISLAEKELVSTFQPIDTVRLSLLGQIISEISLSLEFRAISEEQLDLLINSNIALLKWFGWNAIEEIILSLHEFKSPNTKLSNFNYTEKLQFIAWFLKRNSENTNHLDICNSLTQELWNIFPEQVSYDDLEVFIDTAKGHMQQLSWAGPWLFEKIIQPLLNNQRVSFDHVCRIWLKDLIETLNSNDSNQSFIFSSEREGYLINISAFLWSNSSSSYQVASMQMFKAIHKKQSRVIQQPLASTSNWSRWNNALTISLWISVFTKLCRYYLKQLNIEENEQLTTLLESSYDLATTRPLDEWAIESELVKFTKEVEKILNS